MFFVCCSESNCWSWIIWAAAVPRGWSGHNPRAAPTQRGASCTQGVEGKSNAAAQVSNGHILRPTTF
jgi:hypothetical protein